MRVGIVLGTVTLAVRCAELPPGQLLIVQPENLAALRDGAPRAAEPLVAYDELSAGVGSRISLSEGREAAMPFHPTPVPIDAYCAALLDQVRV